MDPTKSYKDAILDIIRNNRTTTAKHIQTSLGISQPTLFKHLNRLIEEKLITKAGKPPHVFYIYASSIPPLELDQSDKKYLTNTTPEIRNTIQEDFLYVTPVGNMLGGYQGFKAWNQKRGQDLVKMAKEYYRVRLEANKFKKTAEEGIQYIDATRKIVESYKDNYLDKLLYLDFYSLEIFGKTKLAQLTFQAKQSQDKILIPLIIKRIKPVIDYLIRINRIEAVAFVPPTVNRKIQFQKLLESHLDIKLPTILIKKIIFDTPVQQKSLKKLEDRIMNADNTFYINPKNQKYNRILLIDDFVGSGATLNIIAQKIKQKGISKKVYGLGLTGSYKGFEIINQV